MSDHKAGIGAFFKEVARLFAPAEQAAAPVQETYAEQPPQIRARLAFASDYMEGAHPTVLARLSETNLEHSSGYGTDAFCESARQKIRAACACPEAAVYFTVGGTQTNAAVIDGLLRPYQGVLSAQTGHIAVHETGAIEHCGHKVLTLPGNDGKLTAQAVREYCAAYWADETYEHMVMPGMVYLSHPTESGTLYAKAELAAIHEVCRKYRMPLYLDGARLAYALACTESDVGLSDLPKLCDVFYIGGTKCGALFGEAVVVPDPALLPHFTMTIKQHGGLLAKGRLLGVQFDALFTNELYQNLGGPAIWAAGRLREKLKEKGYPLCSSSPTNQVFAAIENEKAAALSERTGCERWDAYDDTRTVVRFVTSWATTPEDIEALIALL